MDIETASAIKTSQVQSEVSVRVAKKTLDAERQQGEAAIELINSAKAIAENTNSRADEGGVDTYA